MAVTLAGARSCWSSWRAGVWATKSRVALPRVGGLAPGETKQLHGKLYLMKNDPVELLARYRRDFPGRN